jgi:hypothetical protein
MTTPVRNERSRMSGVACGLAMLMATASIACMAEGEISVGPGTGSGNAGTSGGSGTAGTGGPVKPIDPSTPQSTSWFESLKSANCSGGGTAVPASRIYRLSSVQWKNTVAQGLGISSPDVSSFPKDQLDPRTGFSTDSTGDKISAQLASSYFDASDRVATQGATAAIAANACLGTAPVTAACAQTFVNQYGARLFRRALTQAETTSLSNYLVAESKLDPAATAVASTLKAMLLSPNFLYRTELGNSKAGAVDLTPDEIAQFLSYTIADGPPDAQLAQAATAGQLADPAMRMAQAQRLAATTGARDKMMSFWREYLAIGDAPTSAGLDQSMHNEATTFFSKVVFDGAGTLKELLTAPYTYADKTVAAVYGTAQPAADGKLMLNPAQRSGFVTSASVMVKTGASSQAATVIHRGLLVRSRLLCQTPPPPPPNFVPDPVQIQQAGDTATAKENYEFFASKNKGCDACHSNFHPLGLPFESYDAAGKFRTSYAAPINKPILTSGTLSGAGDASGDYADVVGLVQRLGNSQIAQYCFAQQFAQYAFGRSVSLDQEQCVVKDMGDYVNSKGGQVRELLASFAASPAVFRRFHQ